MQEDKCSKMMNKKNHFICCGSTGKKKIILEIELVNKCEEPVVLECRWKETPRGRDPKANR